MTISISPLAGLPAPNKLFIDVATLEREYHDRKPDGGLSTRIDTPATPDQKAKLTGLSLATVTVGELAGDPIDGMLTCAPGNNAPIGGLKVVTKSGWFAARPSGTENIYKLHAEIFRNPAYLDAIVSETQPIVAATIK